MQYPPNEYEIFLRDADRLRDCKEYAEAAKMYARVIEIDPLNVSAMVQMANMLKDSQQLDMALSAYRKALELASQDGDIHLQLGHALKLAGDQEGAIQSYVNAAKADSTSKEALKELTGLGQLWSLALDEGRNAIAEALFEIQFLKQRLATLEGNIPSLSSLSAFPVERFDLYTKNYQLPSPPTVSYKHCHSILYIELHDETSLDGREENRKADAATKELKADDWIFLTRKGVSLRKNADDWINFVVDVASENVDLVIFDEIQVHRKTGTFVPIFHPGFQVDWFEGLRLNPSALLVRKKRVDDVSTLSFIETAKQCSQTGRLVHVPALLIESVVDDIRQPTRTASQRPLKSDDTMHVIIPTKNATLLLDRALGSLLARARNKGRLVVDVICSNTSDLSNLRQKYPAVSFFSSEKGFNWSALNNSMAKKTTATNLLFMNDDVEILTNDWDDKICSTLSKPSVGAVGIKLFYPDGKVQHCGIVLGSNGNSEHDGRGQAADAVGPFSRWQQPRLAAAVTGAFLATRSEYFSAVGGFDEERFPVYCNDIDYCLKIRSIDKEVWIDTEVVATHFESQSIRKKFSPAEQEALLNEAWHSLWDKWGDFAKYDPTKNPHYSDLGPPFATITPPSNQSVLKWLAHQASRGS